MNDVDKHLNLEKLLKTVRVCIKNKGGLHRRFNQNNEPYCTLSLLEPDDRYCPFLGEPLLVYEKGEKYECWRRALRCTYEEEGEKNAKTKNK